MKQFVYVLKYLLKGRGNNLIQLLSITLGVTVGVILLAQVTFETSFDQFYPDKERMYQLWTTWPLQQEVETDTRTVYPMIPALREELPEVVSATMCMRNYSMSFNYDNQTFNLQRLVYADSLFFDFFDVKMSHGEGEKGFEKPDNIFISKSWADRIFHEKDPMGQTLLYQGSEPCTVVGVFEDFPKNSHLAFDAVMPICNVQKRGFYIGWNGGAGYSGYVKLTDGADPEAVAAKIQDIVTKHDPQSEQEQTFSFIPITELHVKSSNLFQDLLIKSMLAFIIMAVAAMNYVLTTLSSLATRARTMAMHKCNGNTNRGIFQMMISETAILIFCSLLLTMCLLLGFQQQIGQIVTTPFASLFAPVNLLKVLFVIIPLFLLAGVIPAKIFAAIPVALAFRYYTLNKRGWKQLLLFVQFVGTTLLITLLVIVAGQYNMMLNKDIGYKYDNLLYTSLSTITPEKQVMLKEELKRIPEIDIFSMVSAIPSSGFSGEDVCLPETGESLFNTRWATVDPLFIPAMGITLLKGRNFTDQSSPNQVIVNEEFVRQMRCQGSPLGQTFSATGDYADTLNTIIGVVKDFHISSLHQGITPLMLSYSGFNGTLIIRLREMNPEAISKINEKLSKLFPNTDVTVRVYKDFIEKQYTPEMLFRSTVLLGVIVTLLMVLIGMIGYTNDEIQRRRKEIAIRKVNGATAAQVIRLITHDIQWTLPGGILTGLIIAWVIGNHYLAQFSVKIHLGVGLLSFCGLCVLLLILITVVLKTIRTANENPVKSIKKE